MKFFTLTTLSALAMGMTLATTCVNAADPVTLNITGNVVASPCEVSGDSVNKSVDLGQNIQAASLAAAGSSTSWVNFTVDVINCPVGTTKGTITMHGNADASNPNDMYQSTGTAKNVAVELQGRSGDLLGDGKSMTSDITGGKHTYKLRARAFTQSGSVTPGSISSVVTATFTYQ